MSLGRLLVAVVLVSPVSSCGGSLFAVASELSRAGAGPGYSSDTIVATFVIAAIVSFVIIFAALLVAALPLTMLLDRFGMPGLARDALLVALATGAAIWFVSSLGATFRPAWPVGLAYGLLTSLLWVAAIRRLSPRPLLAAAAEAL
ncbi:hypothetical protein [Sphingosinicella terrae]|uniref:hypothetical protein n=1 Tax=Sphingosinicella terrae TaxID=2172047 RepID=UPI000E0DCF2E|nr:hypothetical protein [Sphingosinicella terrae]